MSITRTVVPVVAFILLSTATQASAATESGVITQTPTQAAATVVNTPTAVTISVNDFKITVRKDASSTHLS